MELGIPRREAIKAVSAARRGTIETSDQEKYVYTFKDRSVKTVAVPS